MISTSLFRKRIFSTGFLHCKVIDGRIIELFLPGQDPYIVISAFECFVIGKGFLVFAVILYNKNLIILPGRSLLNRRNAQFQIIDMIFIWNDNGDQRFLFPEKFRTIQSQVRLPGFPFVCNVLLSLFVLPQMHNVCFPGWLLWNSYGNASGKGLSAHGQSFLPAHSSGKSGQSPVHRHIQNSLRSIPTRSIKDFLTKKIWQI